MASDGRRSLGPTAHGAPADLRAVSVLEQERVVGRGTSLTLWYVRESTGWTKAALCPKSAVSQIPAGAGTVWARHVELTLKVGARLMRVTTDPGSGERRSPLGHLISGSRTARRVSRTHYVVGSSGALKPWVGPANRS